MPFKKLLIMGFGALVLIAGLIFTMTLVRSAEPSARAHANNELVLPLEQLEEGEPMFLQVSGHPLILLRPNHSQQQSIATLDQHVWDPTIRSFNKELQAYVYWGWDTRLGCQLKYVPSGQTPRIKHVEYEEKYLWLGGYSSNCEGAYDLAGRTIKTFEYTYNGFTGETPNLESPNIQRSGRQWVVKVMPK